jgi:hypothetical protein
MNYVDELLKVLSQYLDIQPINRDLFRSNKYGDKLPSPLFRFPVYSALGCRGWEGMIIGFPGRVNDLKSERIGTPFIRLLLYPILELHRRLQLNLSKSLPCIYLIGVRFPDVVLRKLNLLTHLAPNIIVLTRDLLKGIRSEIGEVVSSSQQSENVLQRALCRAMNSTSGLDVPTKSGNLSLGYLSYEVPTFQGSVRPERLDILGYDRKSGSLVAFEIKGPGSGRAELQNLFLQGWEHLRWLEENKRAVKLLYEGPTGRTLNTRKRTRLILGCTDTQLPRLFWELQKKALKTDRYLNIDFIQITKSRQQVNLKSFRELRHLS